ncbi:MAG TPA: nucleotidyltransferase family protein [Candidatus Dormibacteraeota bacterium]|nr:nucleotidyltransferase family protein [Candidatus Dormibacteraeota bacterium]
MTSSNDAACPEKQLLVYCARTRIDTPVADEMCRLLALPLDWDFLLAQAAENSVAPLLSCQLSTIAPDAVPPAQFARLKSMVRAGSVRSLVLSAELIRIVEALATAGIEAFPYKGPVLAVQAYGDVALREFADIDLVLRQSDMAAANRALVALGFAPQFPPIFAPEAPSPLIPGEYDYRDAERHLTVELHTEHTLRHFPVPPNLDDIAGRLARISISGHQIRTFSVEDTLVFLCVHGSKDFWERLLWVADTAQLIAVNPQLDWDSVYRFTDSVRARRMLHLGLALASRVFGVSLPDQVRARVASDHVVDSVASQIERRLLGRSVPPLRSRATFRYRRSMVPGTLAGWRYALRLATVPAAEDWHTIRLPRWLAPLYAALRPFRLLRKYGTSQSTPARPPS